MSLLRHIEELGFTNRSLDSELFLVPVLINCFVQQSNAALSSIDLHNVFHCCKTTSQVRFRNDIKHDEPHPRASKRRRLPRTRRSRMACGTGSLVCNDSFDGHAQYHWCDRCLDWRKSALVPTKKPDSVGRQCLCIFTLRWRLLCR